MSRWPEVPRFTLTWTPMRLVMFPSSSAFFPSRRERDEPQRRTGLSSSVVSTCSIDSGGGFLSNHLVKSSSRCRLRTSPCDSHISWSDATCPTASQRLHSTGAPVRLRRDTRPASRPHRLFMTPLHLNAVAAVDFFVKVTLAKLAALLQWQALSRSQSSICAAQVVRVGNNVTF